MTRWSLRTLWTLLRPRHAVGADPAQKFEPAVQRTVIAAAAVGVSEEGEALASGCVLADVLAAKNVGHVREAGAVLAGAEPVAQSEAAGTELGAGDLRWQHDWERNFRCDTSDPMQYSTCR